MKMEEDVATSGNASTVANVASGFESSSPVAEINFPFTSEDLKNLTAEEIAKLFSSDEYSLCKREHYKNFPICKSYNFSFNDDYDAYSDDQRFEYAFIVEFVVPIIFGIVVLVGVFGNSLVVIVIIFNKQMRSTTNYLIFSLAMADLLFTVFCVPFTATDYIFAKWPFGSIWCKVVQYLTYVTAYASVYTLLLLSLDRYLAVVHPIYAITIRTERNAIMAIIGTWSLIMSSCIPLSFVHGVSEDEQTCMFISETYHYAAFRIGFITTMYIIPLTVIVGLYLMILQRLWSQSAPGGIRSAESVRGKKKVTRMVVIVVVTFIICWLPIQVVLLLKSLGMYEMSSTYAVVLQIFGQVLAYMNSCINPILYAFLSDPFRKAFHKVISCGPSRKTTNGRLTYEATHNTARAMEPQRPSFVSFGQGASPETVTPKPHRSSSTREVNKENGNSAIPENHRTGTTTTSFINTAHNSGTSPSSSQKNLNCVT